jgi:hypothetical protein
MSEYSVLFFVILDFGPLMSCFFVAVFLNKLLTTWNV